MPLRSPARPRRPALGALARAIRAAIAAVLCATPSISSATSPWPDLGKPPPGPSSAPGVNDAALVVGIADYAFAQDIPGADANARDWAAWLGTTHRVPFVRVLLNDQATREEILLGVQAASQRVRPGGRLWVIFVGHGAPSRDGSDGLLIGVDAQQTAVSIEARGVPQGAVIAVAEHGSAGEVVLLVDACFSGKTPEGDLVPGLAPLRVVSAQLGPRTTILSAARSDQFAGPLTDADRPAFSYLVLGALRGWGDANNDGQVTSAEAIAYADKAMYNTIRGRAQTPELIGPGTTVLGASSGEPGPDIGAMVERRTVDVSSGKRDQAAMLAATSRALLNVRQHREALQSAEAAISTDRSWSDLYELRAEIREATAGPASTLAQLATFVPGTDYAAIELLLAGAAEDLLVAAQLSGKADELRPRIAELRARSIAAATKAQQAAEMSRQQATMSLAKETALTEAVLARGRLDRRAGVSLLASGGATLALFAISTARANAQFASITSGDLQTGDDIVGALSAGNRALAGRWVWGISSIGLVGAGIPLVIKGKSTVTEAGGTD